jgi:hypothetical protein
MRFLVDSYPKFRVLRFEAELENLLEYDSGFHGLIHEKTEAENLMLLSL